MAKNYDGRPDQIGMTFTPDELVVLRNIDDMLIAERAREALAAYERRTESSGESTPTEVVEEVREVVNRHSLENRSNTPDHILAQAMVAALEAVESAVQARDAWYGIAPEPGSQASLAGVREALEALRKRVAGGTTAPEVITECLASIQALVQRFENEPPVYHVELSAADVDPAKIEQIRNQWRQHVQVTTPEYTPAETGGVALGVEDVDIIRMALEAAAREWSGVTPAQRPKFFTTAGFQKALEQSVAHAKPVTSGVAHAILKTREDVDSASGYADEHWTLLPEPRRLSRQELVRWAQYCRRAIKPADCPADELRQAAEERVWDRVIAHARGSGQTL